MKKIPLMEEYLFRCPKARLLGHRRPSLLTFHPKNSIRETMREIGRDRLNRIITSFSTSRKLLTTTTITEPMVGPKLRNLEQRVQGPQIPYSSLEQRKNTT